MIKLFLFFIFSLTASFGADSSDDHEKFLSSFINAYNDYHGSSITRKDIVSFLDLNISGTAAKGIYSVRLPHETIICKDLRSISAFEKEKARYLKLDEIVQTINKKSEFPHFANYCGSFLFKGQLKYEDNPDEEHFIILFKQAKGKPLFDLIKTFSLRDNMPDSLKKSYIDMFEFVGEEIAKFHIHFKSEDIGHFMTVPHGDLHAANIFVNTKDFAITFIDYETLALFIEHKEDVKKDTDRLFHFSREELKSKVQEGAAENYFRKIENREHLVMDKEAYIKLHLHLLEECFEALANGYNKILDVHHLNEFHVKL